jgi:short-subunit dehydrogenase
MTKSARKAACAIGGVAALALFRAATARSRRKQLAGRVVLITGGSRGFGLALAHELAPLKCRLALCARDRDELERAKRALAPTGCEVFTVDCDVSDRNAVTGAVDSVIRHLGRIDILVNNAGEIMVSPFENLEVADFERAMAVMFWGTLYTTLAVLPSMKMQGQGRIVNVTSIGGKVSVPHLLSYSCAKAAAVAFSNGLRNEIQQFGIEVTTVIPGLMRTGSHVNAFFKGNHVAETSWFGAAASLPLLSLNAEHAARLAVRAICAGKSETVLGLPAWILSRAQTLLPGFTAEVLRFINALLPKGGPGHSIQVGRNLDDRHGSLYRLLTTLGKRAGQHLNQPV